MLLIDSRAHASFVVSFDFENGGVGLLNYSQFADFNVIDGSVDLKGNGFAEIYPGNGLYVDLNGSTGQSGTIETKTAFDAGLYTLSFRIGNNGFYPSSNSVTVSLGDYSEVFVRSGTVNFDLIERQVLLSSSSKLRFATPLSDNDNTGIIIDAVSLTAVPEPSSVAAFLVGTLLLASRNRIKRQGTMR
ncbi:MAG: PEP-CTERM sorting domain-containing protein [Planctomycetota bacterium]|jgi:hypothetical protein